MVLRIGGRLADRDQTPHPKREMGLRRSTQGDHDSPIDRMVGDARSLHGPVRRDSGGRPSDRSIPGSAVVAPNPIAPPETLVTVGPYAWTRNPIALSHAMALIGLSLVVGSISAVTLVIILSIPVHFAMLHEEQTLQGRFGEAYRAYAASVPRWIPRMGKRQS